MEIKQGDVISQLPEGVPIPQGNRIYRKRYKFLRIPARHAGGNTGKSYVQAQKLTPFTIKFGENVIECEAWK